MDIKFAEAGNQDQLMVALDLSVHPPSLLSALNLVCFLLSAAPGTYNPHLPSGRQMSDADQY